MAMEFLKAKLRWVVNEAAEAIHLLSKSAVEHITWKESFRILRQSIIPGIFERLIGILVLFMVLALFGAVAQLSDAIKGFIGHFR
jgi:hypothetical protein